MIYDVLFAFFDFFCKFLNFCYFKLSQILVRQLAQEVGVSPSLVQDLRSGKKDNLTFKNFSNLVGALGYDIVLERKEERKIAAPKRVKMKMFNHRNKHKIIKCES
jgi:transcriptional regulator with XRE-family HTH domain